MRIQPRPVSPRFLSAMLALTPVACLLMDGWLAHVPSIQERIAGALEAGHVRLEYAKRLEDTAGPLVHGTRFEGHINTTTPPRTDSLNLYVVSPATVELPALRCNCGYVGVGTVLCDSAFLDSFSNSINYDTAEPQLRQTLGRVDALHNTWLASWLIGHEIGHAILHDKNGQFSKQLARSRSVSRQQEDEADGFFASHVPASEIDRATFVLTDFSFQMFSLTYTSANSGAGVSMIRPSADGIHPPWLVRALKVARTMSELKHGAGSGEDFYGRLAQSLMVDDAGRDIGTLCASENLRSQATSRYRPSLAK